MEMSQLTFLPQFPQNSSPALSPHQGQYLMTSAGGGIGATGIGGGTGSAGFGGMGAMGAVGFFLLTMKIAASKTTTMAATTANMIVRSSPPEPSEELAFGVACSTSVSGPVPAALWAATVKEYSTPLVRPTISVVSSVECLTSTPLL